MARYKKRVLVRKTGKLRRFHDAFDTVFTTLDADKWWGGVVFLCLVLTAIVFCSSAAVSAIMAILVPFGITPLATFLWSLTVPAACLPGGMFVAALLIGKYVSDLLPSWAEVPIGRYHAAIPEFAMQTLVDLRRECPRAEFMIVEIIYNRMPIGGPFLAAKDESGEFYLEVWNEPKFVQERVH